MALITSLDHKYHSRSLQICVWLLAGVTVIVTTIIALKGIINHSSGEDKIILLFALTWYLTLIYAGIVYIKQAMQTVYNMRIDGEYCTLKFYFGRKKSFSLNEIYEVEKINSDKLVFVSFLNEREGNYSIRLNDGYRFFIPGTMSNLEEILELTGKN